MQWQPGDLTIHTNKWFLGAGFPGAPPISLRMGQKGGGADRLCQQSRELPPPPALSRHPGAIATSIHRKAITTTIHRIVTITTISRMAIITTIIE